MDLAAERHCGNVALGESKGAAMTEPFEITETSTKVPRCPHCEQDIQRLNARKVKSPFGVRFVDFCDHCRKVLGVSHRKGFWMG